MKPRIGISAPQSRTGQSSTEEPSLQETSKPSFSNTIIRIELRTNSHDLNSTPSNTWQGNLHRLIARKHLLLESSKIRIAHLSWDLLWSTIHKRLVVAPGEDCELGYIEPDEGPDWTVEYVPVRNEAAFQSGIGVLRHYCVGDEAVTLYLWAPKPTKPIILPRTRMTRSISSPNAQLNAQLSIASSVTVDDNRNSPPPARAEKKKNKSDAPPPTPLSSKNSLKSIKKEVNKKVVQLMQGCEDEFANRGVPQMEVRAIVAEAMREGANLLLLMEEEESSSDEDLGRMYKKRKVGR